MRPVTTAAARIVLERIWIPSPASGIFTENGGEGLRNPARLAPRLRVSPPRASASCEDSPEKEVTDVPSLLVPLDDLAEPGTPRSAAGRGPRLHPPRPAEDPEPDALDGRQGQPDPAAGGGRRRVRRRDRASRRVPDPVRGRSDRDRHDLRARARAPSEGGQVREPRRREFRAAARLPRPHDRADRDGSGTLLARRPSLRLAQRGDRA